MLSLLRSNPHKKHLATELQIRGVTGIDASMKWNELCKLMKEHKKKRGCFTPAKCWISSRSTMRISCCSAFHSIPFHSGADLSRPYMIGGENRRLPGKSLTTCIRFAQHAPDLGAPSKPLGVLGKRLRESCIIQDSSLVRL
jgi:hypothetical protein